MGLSLRLVQYAANPALWLDEIALVKGLLGSDLASLLLRPLPFDQVAPKGFILVQKLAVLTLGPSDYVLRVFPFLCSLASLAVFASLAWRILPRTGALIATVLFATCAPLIAFSGLVKQYSSDVFAAVMLMWLVIDLLIGPGTGGRWLRAAITGAALVWISQPAVLVMAASAPLLLQRILHSESSSQKDLLKILAAWTISAGIVTAFSVASMTPTTREYMLTYWKDGFPPQSMKQAFDLMWPWPSIQRLFAGGGGAQAAMGYPFSPLFPVLALIGYGVLWSRRRDIALACVGPFAVTLAAAVARQYPLSDRLILFLVPSILLAIACAIDLLFRIAGKASVIVGATASGLLVVAAVSPVAMTPPPYRTEDVKSLLAVVESKRLPGDATYVYYAAAPVMSVYGSLFGFHRADFLVGGCHRGDTRRYFEELDTFRGTPRLWLILTHSLPLYRERDDILAYLDGLGTRVDEIHVPSRVVGRTPAPAEAFLYDLSVPQGRQGIDASTFEVKGPNVLDPRFGCVKGPQAMIPPDFQCSGPPDAGCTQRPGGGDKGGRSAGWPPPG